MRARRFGGTGVGGTIVMACALLLGSGVALAHARLLAADPAPNAVGPSPAHLRLRFSEPIARSLSRLLLRAADGTTVALVTVQVAEDNVLESRPESPLRPGAYAISWVVIASDDGHRTSGTVRFTVR